MWYCVGFERFPSLDKKLGMKNYVDELFKNINFYGLNVIVDSRALKTIEVIMKKGIVSEVMGKSEQPQAPVQKAKSKSKKAKAQKAKSKKC
jgi:hypothetical protein